MSEENTYTETIIQPDSHRYAGFFRRLAALIIDTLVLAITVGSILWFFTYVYDYTFESDYTFRDLAPLINFVLFILAWGAYYSYFEGSLWRATPGKRLLGIQVLNRSGAPIGYWQAFFRFLGRLLSTATFNIGFLVALFNRRRRTLHDLIAGTIVVRKEQTPD